MSIKQITGYRTIRKLYVQLLYQCNFSCQHCFHGDLLKSSKRLELGEFRRLTEHFRAEYGTQHIVLLGGEPFLHPDFHAMVEWCATQGWRTETCTNGHRFVHRLIPRVADTLDLLRVSIDGLERAHDSMRQRGSFKNAMQTLDLAHSHGIATGVTMTITAGNISDVSGLAELAATHGANELKLHQLRLVGNALKSPTLREATDEQLERLMDWIGRDRMPMRVVFDDDLDPHRAGTPSMPAHDVLDRIELDPDRGLTMSCKAVGTNSQAFYWSDELGMVLHQPSVTDEIIQQIRPVNYV